MTPGANDLCVFAVKRGNIERRIDPHFYLPIFMVVVNKIKEGEYAPLGDIACFSNEYTDYSEFDCGEFKYLEISGVSLGTNKYKTTTVDANNAPSRARMKTQKGDIVISLTRPHRGAIAIIEEDGIIASTGFSVIRSTTDAVDRSWLLYCLLGNSSLMQMLQRSSGGNYPAIIEDELKRIYVPIISLEKQKSMTREIEAVLKRIEGNRIKANNLLRERKNIILEKTSVSISSEQQSLTYAVLGRKLLDRIDADYYSPKFSQFRDSIEHCKYPATSIESISDRIITGFAAGKQDQADDLPDDRRVAQLRPFSITPEGELSFETKKYVPKDRLKAEDYCQKGEVIFNNTNSPDLVGKTTVFDQDVLCATSNHMTRITVKDGVNPYYVAAFFNVLLSIGYWKLLCTNFNNQAGVNIETLKKVRIPLPDISVQNEIAAEIMRRRSQANQLRREAAKEWAEAKAQFERELLGES